MKLSKSIRNEMITNLLLNKEHRSQVQIEIDMMFLEKMLKFFKKIVDAKINGQSIDQDWYKDNMLSDQLDKEEIAWNSGLSLKSIGNIHQSQSKKVVIDASTKHYDELLESINTLLENDPLDLTITISIKSVSVELTINESLVMINAIAVMRAGIRGGVWSTMGKQIEKPLIIVLCKLLKIPSKHYQNSHVKDPNNPRELDFGLIDSNGRLQRCEVKLMGRGNPESADGALARGIQLFLADRLSDSNKTELNKLDIKWVAIADSNVLENFAKRLQEINIDVTQDPKDIMIERDLKKILKNLD